MTQGGAAGVGFPIPRHRQKPGVAGTLRFSGVVARSRALMQDNDGLSVTSGRILSGVAEEVTAIEHSTGGEQERLLNCLPPWSG